MKEKVVEIKHGGLRMRFEADTTYIKWDHIDEEVVSASVGERAIQDLILIAIQFSPTTAAFQKCMADIREFYSHYLIDKSALNTLAMAIKFANGTEFA